MDRTLLLSCGYEPLGTIGWQRAITLLTLNKVEIVESYDCDIRSVHLIIKMPAVVRLISAFRRHKKKVKFSRQNVLGRDKWKCQYCGETKQTHELTYDHVVPRAQGGITCWENIVSCCEDCNAKKADRTPAQAGMRLLKQPVRPQWVPIYTVTLSRKALPDQWATYLYWNSSLEST